MKLQQEIRRILPNFVDLHAMATDDCANHFIRHFKLFGDWTAVGLPTAVITTSHYCCTTTLHTVATPSELSHNFNYTGINSVRFGGFGFLWCSS